MLSRFATDKRGTVAVMFGLSLVPLIGLSGAAIDYARGAQVRTELAAALDSAVLQAAKTVPGQTDARVGQVVKSVVAARFDTRQLGDFQVSASARTGTLEGTASGKLQTAFMSVLGIQSMPVTVSSAAAWGTANLEVALVLDNTGSMAETLGSQRKIDALISAAREFVSTMQGVASTPASSVKIGVVPFDTNINVGPLNSRAWWIDMSGQAPGTTWQGCIWDRATPNDASASPPRLGDPASLYGPDPARLDSTLR